MLCVIFCTTGYCDCTLEGNIYCVCLFNVHKAQADYVFNDPISNNILISAIIAITNTHIKGNQG